ncbi:hypothetical protein ZWY2020_046060 [Hordeum vulgare]|nr:hypothetical protein ZWY2020_046060 [Hordeum vulgare]
MLDRVLLMRVHNAAVFKQFEKDGRFVCFPMETNHASVTPMHNTYRASQVMFPGDDDVLARAGHYCRAFLQKRQASNDLYDKWIITKDFPGEVGYTLNFPWKASLPRIKTRMYLDQYGGNTDVWIAKVLYRRWTQKGLAHNVHCPIADIDDTAMGFRLPRQHGYDVNPSVFKQFEKDGRFVCFPMETNHASVTPMHNTYRASQFMFPGDDNVLARAGHYCRAFLQERQASNNLYDKWIITKNFPGEVGYTLNFPWKASLPRIKTRMYLDQYGGNTDVWIAKVLYRMNLVSNDMYLKMAKSDFREYQRLSRLEWNGLRKWYFRNHVQRYGGTPKSALTAYFLASANIFEPGRASERLAWARMAVLAEAVTTHFRHIGGPCNSTENLEDLIDLVSFDDVSGGLREGWKQWLMAWTAKESHGSIDGDTALLFVRTIKIVSGRNVSAEKKLNLWDYSQLEQLTSSICHKLATIGLAQNEGSMDRAWRTQRIYNGKWIWRCKNFLGVFIRVARQSTEKPERIFLNVVKSFYYSAHCSPETVDSHIAKVIFQDVI